MLQQANPSVSQGMEEKKRQNKLQIPIHIIPKLPICCCEDHRLRIMLIILVNIQCNNIVAS